MIADDEWEPYYVLVNPLASCDSREEAADLAGRHLFEAFGEKARPEAMAVLLRSLGYVRVDGFQLVDFQAADEPEEWEPEDLEGGRRVGAAILQAVDNQVRDGDPPETRQTLQRLIEMGHEEDEAKELIATILSTEIFGIVKNKDSFDRERYVRALERLPELPESFWEE